MVKNALYVPEMRGCVIHPIIMRLVGTEVNECPKVLSPNPSINNHSIRFLDRDLRIPLKLHGVISYLPCRKPGEDELMDHDGVLELTESMLDFSGNFKYPRPKKCIISLITTYRVWILIYLARIWMPCMKFCQ